MATFPVHYFEVVCSPFKHDWVVFTIQACKHAHTIFIFCTAQNVHWTMPWRKSKRYSFEHKMVYDSLILNKKQLKNTLYWYWCLYSPYSFFIISILTDLGKNFGLWVCSIRCLLRWEKPLNKGIPIRWPHVEARIECMLNPYWYM